MTYPPPGTPGFDHEPPLSCLDAVLLLAFALATSWLLCDVLGWVRG